MLASALENKAMEGPSDVAIMEEQVLQVEATVGAVLRNVEGFESASETLTTEAYVEVEKATKSTTEGTKTATKVEEAEISCTFLDLIFDSVLNSS